MFSFFSKKNTKGQIMIVLVVFFISITTVIILGLTNPIVRHISMATSIAASKQSYYAAEAGAEDTVYRLIAGIPVSSPNTVTLGSYSAEASVSDELLGKKIVSIGEANDYIRKVESHLIFGSGASFHYGIQAGNGGFVLQNSSSVTGNVYSSGPIIGAGNLIDGDVVSAEASGLIDGVHVGGSAFAHTIEDSIVDKNAYYQTINGSIVAGDLYPGSSDQPAAALPISDEQIAEWEADAAAGGTIPSTDCTAGTYSITSSRTLGPVKIECNLEIKGNEVVVTIAGPVWVVGNIITQTGPTVRMAPSLGSQNVAIIADNPSNPSGSGFITVGQNSKFQNSGSPRSFVFLISMNNSAETGGTSDAFIMGQSSGALVAYASHGQVTLGQSVDIKEATAYKIILQNTANVVYDMGLPSTLFSSGPSGGFDLAGWREVE